MVITSAGAADYSQENNFGFLAWPGKGGEIKLSIQLPTESLVGFGIIYSSSTYRSLSLKLPLCDDDTVKNGMIYIQIFSSIDEAQTYLLDSLWSITSPQKPQYLIPDSYSPGDIAFGREYPEIDKKYSAKSRYLLIFTRSNVFVKIIASPDSTQTLASILDNIIETSQNGSTDNKIPELKISEEFKKVFQKTLRK
jgi:hypothetical protein